VKEKNEFQMDIEEDEIIVNQATNVNVARNFDALQIDRSCRSVEASKEQSMAIPARNKVYYLDDRVSVWSDFVGTQYHPKSVNIIKEYLHEAEHFAFDTFGYGQSLYIDKDFRDDFENSLHFFVEECDQLQGFQVKPT
jgi:hypothetical protein